MYNATDTAKGIEKIIRNTSFVVNLGATVSRGGFVNNDHNKAPWIGVYRGKVKVVPRTLGSGEPWQVQPDFRIVVQETDFKSHEKCEDKLNDLVNAVLVALMDDTTLDGTVDMVTDIDIEYGYMDTEVETLHFQSAIVTITTEAQK